MTFGLVLFFVFMVLWRPQEWLVPELYGIPLLWPVIAACTLGLILESSANQLKPFRGPHLPLLIGLFFATIMSHVRHTYFEGITWALEEVSKMCYFSWLLLTVLDRPSRLRKLVWVIVGMTTIMAIHAIMQETQGYGFAGQRPLRFPVKGEAGVFTTRSLFFGIFEDPNDLAQILCVGCAIVFAIPRHMNFFKFVLCSLVCALLVRAVISTGSRGGFLTLFAMGVCCLGLFLPVRWMPRTLFLIAVGALVLCPFSGSVLDASAHDRVVFWGDANAVFKQYPVFGLGYNMFPEIANDRASHNAFVAAYTELGVFGYWFWFGLTFIEFPNTPECGSRDNNHTGAHRVPPYKF